jgi:ADP-heptose:LPS heptosyltransferase
MTTLALIKLADIIITPDTSIAHAANAFNKPTIAIYGNDKVNMKIWGPLSDKCLVLTTDKDFNKYNFKEIIKGVYAVLK